MTQCSFSGEKLNLIRWPFLERLETKLNRCARECERLSLCFLDLGNIFRLILIAEWKETNYMQFYYSTQVRGSCRGYSADRNTFTCVQKYLTLIIIIIIIP